MKSKIIFIALIGLLALESCKNTESDVLQQARLTQQGLVSKKQSLMTELDNRYKQVEQEIAAASTSVSPDTTHDISSEILFMEEEKSAIDELRDKVENWAITNIVLLPEPGQLKNDPKFKDLKDEDLLKMVKDQDSIFSILKSEIENELLLYEDF
ncbi:MAG: hypothetical protein FJX90_03860 [Bacteroidetes bacterium]|nr:hypothetical protein [Bacteroidota bacterium]